MAFNNTETQDYVDEVTTQGGTTDGNQVDQLITDLKNAGVYSKLDAFWLFANESVEAARINVINPTGTSITENNTPRWHIHAGYVGDGSAYLDTGFSPSGNTNYAQNSASFGVFIRDNARDGKGHPMGTLDSGVSQRCTIFYRADDAGEYYINDTSSPEVSSFPSQGLIHLDRDGASSKTLYRNGSSVSTSSASSTSLIMDNFYILARNFGGSANEHTKGQVSFAFIGASMTATEASDFYSAVNTYLDAEFSDLSISASSSLQYTGVTSSQLLVPNTTNAGEDHREPGNIVYDPDDTEDFRWKCFVSRTDGAGTVVIDMYHGADLTSQMTAYSGNPIISSYAEDPYVVISDQANGVYWLYCEDNSTNDTVGRYSSTDRGRNWSSDGSVGLTDAASPTVFTEDDGSTWTMLYEKHPEITNDTRMATSNDGLAFSEVSKSPVVAIGTAPALMNDLSADSAIVIDDIVIKDGLYHLFHHEEGVTNGMMLYSNTLDDRPDYNEYGTEITDLTQPFDNPVSGNVELLTLDGSNDLYHATFDGITTATDVSFSLNTSQSVSSSSTSVAEAGISLDANADVSDGSTSTGESNLTVSHIQQASTQSTSQAEGGFSLSNLLQIAFSKQSITDASFSLPTVHQVTTVSDTQEINEASFSLALQKAITTEQISTIEVSYSLNSAQQTAISSDATGEAAISLTLQAGLSLVSTALAEAGISFNAVQSLTLSGQTVGVEVTLSDGRTLTIKLQNRTLSIPDNNRTFTINAENRTLNIEP